MKSANVETLKGPGIRVEMDEAQIFPADPGQGTPVVVVLCDGRNSTGTWNCVTDQGETVDGDRLTQEQLDWLEDVRDEVEAWMEEHGC